VTISPRGDGLPILASSEPGGNLGTLY
jgi:hypothetical protein